MRLVRTVRVPFGGYKSIQECLCLLLIPRHRRRVGLAELVGVSPSILLLAEKFPGVRELFKKAAPEREKRTRFEMMKTIDADYYGYRDDDDGILVELERAEEPKKLQKNLEQWDEKRRKQLAADPDSTFDDEEDEAAEVGFVAHVAVPDQDAIKRAVLARRKREILAKLLDGEREEEKHEAVSNVPSSW